MDGRSDGLAEESGRRAHGTGHGMGRYVDGRAVVAHRPNPLQFAYALSPSLSLPGVKRPASSVPPSTPTPVPANWHYRLHTCSPRRHSRPTSSHLHAPSLYSCSLSQRLSLALSTFLPPNIVAPRASLISASRSPLSPPLSASALLPPFAATRYVSSAAISQAGR